MIHYYYEWPLFFLLCTFARTLLLPGVPFSCLLTFMLQPALRICYAYATFRYKLALAMRPSNLPLQKLNHMLLLLMSSTPWRSLGWRAEMRHSALGKTHTWRGFGVSNLLLKFKTFFPCCFNVFCRPNNILLNMCDFLIFSDLGF